MSQSLEISKTRQYKRTKNGYAIAMWNFYHVFMPEPVTSMVVQVQQILAEPDPIDYLDDNVWASRECYMWRRLDLPAMSSRGGGSCIMMWATDLVGGCNDMGRWGAPTTFQGLGGYPGYCISELSIHVFIPGRFGCEWIHRKKKTSLETKDCSTDIHTEIQRTFCESSRENNSLPWWCGTVEDCRRLSSSQATCTPH